MQIYTAYDLSMARRIWQLIAMTNFVFYGAVNWLEINL